jgi:acetylornithine deacetylase/succinyl-diaminopimelate desuccinylase-like protein
LPRRLRRTPWILATLLLAFGSGRAVAAAGPSADAERLSTYIRFDTTNPPGSERVAIDWLATLARQAGASTEVVLSPGGRANLIARLPATVPDAPVIALLHHVDVVPAGPGWRRPPFSGDRHEGAIWGRGAIDAKSYGIAHLAALLEAARLPERRRDLLLLAVADEEAGGAEGVGWLLGARPALLDRLEVVLNEGGGNKSVGERLLYWGIEIDQKRPLWLEVRSRGRGGHASNADPESPAHLLVRGLARLVAAPPPLSGSQAALDFLRRLGRLDPRAQSAVGPAQKLLAGGALDDAERRALVGYESLLRDTLQVTTLTAAERINVVAREARASIDVRLLPETDSDTFLAAVRAAVGADLEVEVVHSTPAAGPSSTESALYREISTLLSDRAPVVPLFIPAFTDSRYFRARGVAAYGFSPFVLDARELLTVHAENERISLTAFDRGVETMKSVVRALVGPLPTR